LEKYKVEYKKAASLVNDFDPCGFIHLGAPLDEYDFLTNKIISYKQENKTKDEIKNMIIYEIEHHFGCMEVSTLKEPLKARFHKNLDELLHKL